VPDPAGASANQIVVADNLRQAVGSPTVLTRGVPTRTRQTVWPGASPVTHRRHAVWQTPLGWAATTLGEAILGVCAAGRQVPSANDSTPSRRPAPEGRRAVTPAEAAEACQSMATLLLELDGDGMDPTAVESALQNLGTVRSYPGRLGWAARVVVDSPRQAEEFDEAMLVVILWAISSRFER
jgi:hypothetical protein